MTIKNKIKLLKEKGYKCIFNSHSKVILVEKPLKSYFTDEQLEELVNGITYDNWNKLNSNNITNLIN